MRSIISLTAALALCAYSNQAAAQAAPDNQPQTPMPEQAAQPPAPAAAPAAFQINETTWTFTTKKGTKAQASVDANGNYIINSIAGKHLDHGTAVMKGDKVCFTSAMDKKEGEVCWTTKPVEIGQSMDSVSSKGEKLTVTRAPYVPMSMPPQKTERG